MHAGKLTCTDNAELRPLIHLEERWRQREIEQFETAERFQFGQIAGDGSKEIRE